MINYVFKEEAQLKYGGVTGKWPNFMDSFYNQVRVEFLEVGW